jgi:hypothetical protein
MSDKWQLINLKLDAELAQVLREMKQGHDESLAEVIIRLLRKVARVNPAGARGAPIGRSSARGRTGRGAVGAGGKGKPRGSAGRAAPGVAARGRPRSAPAAEWAAEGATRNPEWVAEQPSRGPRRNGGNVGGNTGRGPRPQPFGGASEPRRPRFQPGKGVARPARPRAEQGTAEDRPKRPRKVKGRRPNAR